MHEAERQAVAGLVGASLMEPDSGVLLPKKTAARLMKLVYDTSAANNAIAASLQELCHLMGSASIPFIVVKGQTVGALYPDSSLRSPGDIDFYVAPPDWDDAVRLISQTWNTGLDEEDGGQHVSCTHDGTLFEMHYNLYKFYNKHNQAVFDKILAYNIAHRRTMRVPHVDAGVPVMCPADNILYTFLHLYHHLVELGCGLRQFCDVAVLLDKFDASRDGARLADGLNALGFSRAFRAIGAVLVDHLGLPAERFPLPLDSGDRRYSHEILSIIFDGGNFGFYSPSSPLVSSGWKYYVRVFCRKLGRYITFYRLAPRETRAMLLHEMPGQVGKALGVER